jgi:hypothetical protein
MPCFIQTAIMVDLGMGRKKLKILSNSECLTPSRALMGASDSSCEKGLSTAGKARRKKRAWLGISLFMSGAALLAGCNEASTSPQVDPNALITLTSPQAGKSFRVGQDMSIQWTTKADASDPVDNVDIQYSPTGSSPWGFVRTNSIELGSANWGNYSWTVTDSILIGGVNVSTVSMNGRIRVMQYSTADSTRISMSGPISITSN